MKYDIFIILYDIETIMAQIPNIDFQNRINTYRIRTIKVKFAFSSNKDIFKKFYHD